MSEIEPTMRPAARRARLLNDSLDEFVERRRDIHREPELAFEERRTAALVAARLEAWGYEVERGLGGTGVFGSLRRGGHANARYIGLRADMDALPIAEATGLAWASRRPGVMHACGHDGHTAMLLTAARRLAEQGRFDGRLTLIFQPAEEGFGGARRMMDDGLFERHPCDAVFAMHNAPGLAQGHLMFRDGSAMASSDNVTVTLNGVGGHGAMPHGTADPVVAAASVVMALQTVVARNIDPMQMAVVTVGALHAGQANKVIPGRPGWNSACARWPPRCAACSNGASMPWCGHRPRASGSAPRSIGGAATRCW